jgi:hypothetical protein
MWFTDGHADNGIQVGSGGAENLAALETPRADYVVMAGKKFIDGELEAAA